MTNCEKVKGDDGKEFTQLLQLHNIHLKRQFWVLKSMCFVNFKKECNFSSYRRKKIIEVWNDMFVYITRIIKNATPYL